MTSPRAREADHWSVQAKDASGRPLLVVPSTWAALPIQQLIIPGDAEFGPLSVPGPALELAIDGFGNRFYKVGAQVRQLSTRPGMIEIYRSGFEVESARWTGIQGSCLHVSFPESITSRMLRDESRFDLEVRHEVFDDRISRLLLEMASDARSGMLNGPLYSEGLSLALLAVLSTHYRKRAKPSRSEKPLSVADKSLVIDYIEENIGSELTVDNLARLVDLSPFAFAKQFKAAFDASPHQYVLRQRITRATAVLKAKRSISIEEVARDLGFSSHAHFSATYKRLMGFSPSALRQ